MLKMIEVVGKSQVDYAEAVREAVEALVAAGERPHFFTVIEQRGSVRDGRVEFQAVIKVAVEAR